MDLCERIEEYATKHTDCLNYASMKIGTNSNGHLHVLALLALDGSWCVNWDRVKEYIQDNTPVHFSAKSSSRLFWAAKGNLQEISFAELEKLYPPK